ncbi:TIGR02117 family protein [Moraxella oblonga]|uniref:TIGR02117 family protein n=1 Tax=Moraxella oblonga TaxID=200413 RepID=UPI0008374637|nr:TIGR02117 family protein [Moraxella oblonga]
MSKFIKIILKTIGYFATVLLIYGVLMTCATFLPSQLTTLPYSDDMIDVYVLSNGVHTDFVLPTTHQLMDWTTIFHPNDTKNGVVNHWISIGWGDRDFYLNTPTWGDLTAKTAVNALSGLSTSAIHVSYESDELVKNCQKCRKIRLNPTQYQAVITHIKQSLPSDGRQVAIAHAHYGQNDAFYPAVGSYNAFYTCNSWVNNGLKKAEVKTALWTVLDVGVIKER